MPAIPIELVLSLVGCFVWCALYAVWLTVTKPGMALSLKWTEVSVVVGVAFVLCFFALVDITAAGIAFLFFAAGGAPMVIRSIWLRAQHEKSATEYLGEELKNSANDGAE